MPGLIRTQSIIDISVPFYSTSFATDETTLSEGGRWTLGQTVGVDWGDFQASGGKVFGKRAQDFRDNTAILTGTWPNNQYAQATIFKGSPNNSFFPEDELRLRSLITANVNRGYEIGWSLRGGSSSYLIIVRWNGPAESFDYLFNQTGSQYEVLDGDIVKATIVGNTITAYINGVSKASVDITSIGGTVWSSGTPGIGTNANSGGSGSLNQYGFYDFQAGGA